MKFFIVFLLLLAGCTAAQPEDEKYVITVGGPIAADSLGLTLIHEHVLVDFIGADSTGYHRWDRDSAFQVILPHLLEVRKAGVSTIFEYTPAFLGRDPRLLKMLADASGLQLITNTGLYGAVDNKYLPPYAWEESADELAARWIREFEEGIEDTGIRPGFIKISVAPDSLSPLHEKLVRAAARTHKATGLTIASHTGPALPAFQQLDVLASENVPPEAFIWVHAQNEKDLSRHTEFAERGGWVSLDGLAWGDLQEYLKMVTNLKNAGYLDRVLLSHDAGWYSPGEQNGGEFRGYTVLIREFIPLLRNNGFTRDEIDQLVIENPRQAFAIPGLFMSP